MWARVVACGVLAVGCGREGFDLLARTDASGAVTDGAGDGAAPDDGTPGDTSTTPAIAWVKKFDAKLDITGGTQQTFTTSATTAGDAVLFHLACKSPASPTGVALTAPGWTFTPIGAMEGSATAKWVTSFGAFAPNTANATFTITWTVANCTDRNHIADEFHNVASFDTHVETFGAGACLGNVSTTHPGDAVWGACTSSLLLGAPGAGYTKGASDGAGDFSAFKTTTDPSGTVEAFKIDQAGINAYNLTVVALSPE